MLVILKQPILDRAEIERLLRGFGKVVFDRGRTRLRSGQHRTCRNRERRHGGNGHHRIAERARTCHGFSPPNRNSTLQLELAYDTVCTAHRQGRERMRRIGGAGRKGATSHQTEAIVILRR